MSDNETVNDSTSEEVIADVSLESVDAFDLDALINTHFEDDIMAEPALEHKIGVPYEEVLRHIPENGRKVIQNLRASYTKKTQDPANEKKRTRSPCETTSHWISWPRSNKICQ